MVMLRFLNDWEIVALLGFFKVSERSHFMFLSNFMVSGCLRMFSKVIYYFIIEGIFASCVYCFVWSFGFFFVFLFFFSLLNLVIWFVLCWVYDSTWRVMCLCLGKDGSLVMENLFNLCLGIKIIHILGTSLISFDEFCSIYRTRTDGWKVEFYASFVFFIW